MFHSSCEAASQAEGLLFPSLFSPVLSGERVPPPPPCETAIRTNQCFSCLPAHSTQHGTLWEYRKRPGSAGLLVPDPGSLHLHQRVLAELPPPPPRVYGRPPYTMTVKNPFESIYGKIHNSFGPWLMAEVQSGTFCWKQVLGYIISITLFQEN